MIGFPHILVAVKDIRKFKGFIGDTRVKQGDKGIVIRLCGCLVRNDAFIEIRVLHALGHIQIEIHVFVAVVKAVDMFRLFPHDLAFPDIRKRQRRVDKGIGVPQRILDIHQIMPMDRIRLQKPGFHAGYGLDRRRLSGRRAALARRIRAA